MGCLTLPFRLLAAVLLAAMLVAGWLYRDRIEAYARGRFSHAPPVSQEGRPGAASLAHARRALASLQSGVADSAFLDAAEMASLVGDALDPDVRSQIDSLRLRLGDGRVGLRASLRTARLPHELLGPLAVAARSREPIAVEGAMRILRPGVAEWDIDQLTVRDFPLPREAIPGLIGRAFGEPSRQGLKVTLPSAVRRLRVRPDGVTLFTRDR